MTPLAIRHLSRRFRAHGAALIAAFAIASAIAVHHSGVAMGGVHHDAGMSSVELCLGVFVAVGTAVAVAAIGMFALGRRWHPTALSPVGLGRAGCGPEPRPRAGPALLSLLCVLRR